MLAGELLDSELSRGLPSEVEAEHEIIDFGSLLPGEVSELAETLAGTSDKKSRAYKSQRRKVERWNPSQRARARGVRPMRPSETGRARLRSASRQASDRIRRFRAHGGDMRVFVIWGSAVSASKNRKGEWLPPGEWIHIRQQVMRRVINEWADGSHDAAASTLFREFLEQYKVGNVEDFESDAEVIELRLEPTR